MPRTPSYRGKATLKHYFREWRLERNLTQQRLADRMGTTKTRVSRKENYKEGWDDAYLAALAEALAVSEPGSLIMRNPADESAPWSLLETLSAESRAKVVEFAEMLKLREENKTRAA